MSDNHYKVRCTGNDDGTYTLSYGKGSKKLTQRVERYGEGQKWFIPGGSPSTSEEDGTPGPHLVNTLGKLKQAWEVWAKEQYNKGGCEAESTQPASPPKQTPDSPVVESKNALGLDGKRRRKDYTAEGSNVGSDEDEPLPVVGTDGELVAEKNGYEIRVHSPNKRFPYTDGYALIETATRIQSGWMKDRSRALQALDERF